MVDHIKLATAIHQDNITAGWWKQHIDPLTSHTELVTVPRNIGELLCLVHSEISEAYEGFKLGLKDDHLPFYPMFHVELADASIRLYDIFGYYKHPIDIHPAALFDQADVKTFLLEIHLRISEGMEHFRKGRTIQACERLTAALGLIWRLAVLQGINLELVIEEKREYNRNRADHKLENRSKEGGKAF